MSRRLSNPINQQMIDIWDQGIMLIEQTARPTTMAACGVIGSHEMLLDLQSTWNSLLNVSWSTFRLAVAQASSAYIDFPDDYQKLIRDATLEPTMTVLEERGRTPQGLIDLIESCVSLSLDLHKDEKTEDLVDFAWNLHRLANITLTLYTDFTLNSDRLRHKVNLGLEINQSVWDVLDLQMIEAPEDVLNEVMINNLDLLDEVMRNWQPPLGYRWVSYWYTLKS